MSRAVIAMGLQKVGKTTFLAALWDVLTSAEVPNSLTLERTEGDMQYLAEIRESWANYQKITRTGPAGDTSVVMRINAGPSIPATELAWTDMLGERFESQWTERAWTRGYQSLVDSAVGVVLFVHPGQVREARLITEAMRLQGALPPDQSGDEAAEVANQPALFDPRKVATQVQLVELLQFLDGRRGASDPLRLAVVVSAWDLVEKTERTTPDVWLGRRLPLLGQYVTANNHRFESKVFGVSSQGCDYEDAAEVARMRGSLFRSSDRIKVVLGSRASHDITAPILWAIGGSLS